MRKKVYQIYVSGEEEKERVMKVVSEHVKDESDISLNSLQYYLPVIRFRCTRRTFRKISFALDLNSEKVYI